MPARRSALLFIIATLVIDMLGIGLVWPILPPLIKELTGSTVDDAAAIYGLLLSVYAVMQFLVSPLIGALSDRVGRRPVLLVSLAALGADYVLLALAPNLWWIVVGRVLAGILGATISVGNAYIADVTPKEGRAAAFGLVGAAFGVGFTLGPLLGGVLGEIDLRLPFWFAAALSFANVAFGYFFLPESLPQERRKDVVWKQANPFGAILHIRRYGSHTALFVAVFLTALAQQGLQGIWVLWTEAQFSFGIAEAGYSLAWVGLCMIFVQGYLVRVVVPRFGERRVILGGWLLSMVAFCTLAFITEPWLLYVNVALHICGWGCAEPAIKSTMSQAVPENEQGLLQGTLSSVVTLTMIFGPLLATQIFAATSGPDAAVDFPGAFYLVGSLFFVGALMVLGLGGRLRKGGLTPAE